MKAGLVAFVGFFCTIFTFTNIGVSNIGNACFYNKIDLNFNLIGLLITGLLWGFFIGINISTKKQEGTKR